MAQGAARIVRDEDVMDGEPRIAGRRVTVLRIQELVEGQEFSAADVAEMHDLDIADVYAALTYYHEHPSEMESVRAHRRDRERTARDAGAPTVGELQSDRGSETRDKTDEERMAEGYQKHAERSQQLAEDMEVTSSEATQRLGDAPDWNE